MCFYVYYILYAEEWNQLLIVWKLMLCKLHETMVLFHLKRIVFTVCVFNLWSFLLA